MLNKIFIYASILLIFVSINYAQTTQWSLYWDPNTEDNMSYYKVFRDTHPAATTQYDTTVHPHTEYIDTDLVPGVQYYYRIKAVNTAGLESDFSDEVSAAIPNITNISNQIANQGQNITINLNNFVTDPDHGDNQITWTYSGNSQFSVSINASNVATLTPPSSNWYGSETISLTATDPDEFYDVGNCTFIINAQPVVSNIPNQNINQGGTFTTINLNNYVADPDNNDSEITWTADGNSNLNVSINTSRIATISTPSPNWYGQETISFTATDPNGASDNISAIFTVNGQPQITRSSPMDQQINYGESFAAFDLDNFVADPDNADSELNWSYSGNNILQVNINTNHVVTITPQTSETVGSDTITFRVQDPGGLSDQINAVFTIKSMGTPSIAAIPNQYINQGGSFQQIALDNYVEDPESPDNEITWTYSGSTILSVSISPARIATITTTNPSWAGNDTITFTATDPEGNSSSISPVFTINGAPVIAAMPNQTVEYGENFSSIGLDNYVSDPNDPDNDLTWSYTGNTDLSVDINSQRIASITKPVLDWSGNEQITFKVTDPGSLADSFTVTLTVLGLASPNAPVISAIPDQIVDMDAPFSSINLNEIVSDPDTDPQDITWTYSGNSELIVEINAENIARIARLHTDWLGSETIAFTATDPEANSATKTATFTVNAQPVIMAGINQTVEFGQEFSNINLDEYVNDLNNNASELTWHVTGNSELYAYISPLHILSVQKPNADWTGSEIINLTVTDTYGSEDSSLVTFTVLPEGVEFNVNILSISGQTITQGQEFEAIDLDDYVDCDNSIKSQLTWDCYGHSNLNVSINDEHVAEVSCTDPGWYGKETITFRANTANGISVETSADFVVRQNIFSALDFHLMGSGTVVEVRWYTMIPVGSRIRFGTENLDESSSVDNDLKLEHKHIISNLMPNTVYNFQAVGTDSSGDQYISAVQAFETGSESNINVFPNPFNAGKYPDNDVVNFVNLPQGASLQIYNLLGEPVFNQKDINHLFRWAAVNDHNEVVQAGLYLYVVKNAKNKKLASGKIVVIR